MVGSIRISHSSEMLWLSLLPERMQKTQPKMKALECSQHLSHYKSMGVFQTLKGSLLRSPWPGLVEFRTHLRLYGCPC